jgi:hypothetical protein
VHKYCNAKCKENNKDQSVYKLLTSKCWLSDASTVCLAALRKEQSGRRTG